MTRRRLGANHIRIRRQQRHDGMCAESVPTETFKDMWRLYADIVQVEPGLVAV